MSDLRVGLIGGTGLGEALGVEQSGRRHEIETPFGRPSDAITVGTLAGRRVAFLPRHGVGHRFPPSAIPARANFYALKSLGVRAVISVSAVGSLREEIAPLHLVVPSQIVDRTTSRLSPGRSGSNCGPRKRPRRGISCSPGPGDRLPGLLRSPAS